MKSVFSLILIVSLLLTASLPVASVPLSDRAREELSLSAQSAVLVSAEDREILYEKNAHVPLGMASTTKLMTALVVCKHTSASRVISIPPAATGIEGSSVYLSAGEKITVEELLYALLLSSANDAAVALALAIAPTVEDFCVLMNETASELGLVNTHFVNPHGLYHEEHYTTAYELAIIASAVLEVPLLRQIVATKKATVSHDGKADQRLLVNHNRLLSSYEGAIGMKTGFTKKTGRTLVSAAERDDLTLIAVTLNAPDDWRDHATLLDYGFTHYEMVTFAEMGEFRYAMPITGGAVSYALLVNEEPLRLVLPKNRKQATHKVCSPMRFWYASQKQPNPVARVTFFCEGKETTSPLLIHSEKGSPPPNQEGVSWSRLSCKNILPTAAFFPVAERRKRSDWARSRSMAPWQPWE